MPENIQINKIENGWIVAYPEKTNILGQGQGQKMTAHFCVDMEEVVEYLSMLNK
jgi:hypothetical protein